MLGRTDRRFFLSFCALTPELECAPVHVLKSKTQCLKIALKKSILKHYVKMYPKSH